MDIYKKTLDDKHSDRIFQYKETCDQDDECENDLNDDLYAQDPSRVLLDLQSTYEINILKSYAALKKLCENDFVFPKEYFQIVIDHTVSKNITIAEFSQGFLFYLFEKHPIQNQFFDQIEKEQYFCDLICSTFNGKTVPFLIASFRNKSLREAEFLQTFFETFFFHLDFEPESADFYLRLEFLRIFISIFASKNSPFYGQFLDDNCQDMILQYFPLLSRFDNNLLYVFLSIISYFMNIEGNDEWLDEFIQNNYVSTLLTYYSPGNDDINYCIIKSLCGISGSNKDISSILFSLDLLSFFGNNFFDCKDERILPLFLKIILNMMICDDSDKLEFINDFISSQFFRDIIDTFDEDSLNIKLKIIELICFLVCKLKEEFIQFFVEYNLIQIFIDAFYLSESGKTKTYVIYAITDIFDIYNKSKINMQDQAYASIEDMFTNMDFVEAIDDYIDEQDQNNPSFGLTCALNIRDSLYSLNSLS